MPLKMPDFEPSQKPSPSYFIVRTRTGHVVPLIAVDELPPILNVVGVPRALDLAEASGMINLGLQEQSDAFYQVVRREIGGKDKERKEKEKDDKNASSNEPLCIVPPPSLDIGFPAKASRRPSSSPSEPSSPDSYLAGPPRNASAQHSPSNPKTPSRNISRSHQQTCRHWCAHGICKWGINCYYRHMMPINYTGLQEVGLRDWPVWYRRANPGLFVSDLVVGGKRDGVSAPVPKGNAKERVDKVMGGKGNPVTRHGVTDSLGSRRFASVRSSRVKERRSSRVEEKTFAAGKENDRGKAVVRRLQDAEVRGRQKESGRQNFINSPVVRGGGQAKASIKKSLRRGGKKGGFDDRVAKGEALRWEDDAGSDVSACSTFIAETSDDEEDIGREMVKTEGKFKGKVAEGELIDVSVSEKETEGSGN